MKSICLNCLVYTLKDKEVKDNMYLSIFYIWLGKVIQSGGLTSNDALKITIDSRTLDFLNNNVSPLPILLDKLPCSFEFVTVDPPSNSLEGMMNKYIFTEYSQDAYIYCDIDILISNSFHTMVENTKDNTAYFCKEDYISDDNHGEGFNHEIADKSLPGFSAGKFCIVGKEARDTLFDIIHSFCDYSTKFYTVEQPFFNKAIYHLPRGKMSVDIDLLTKYVSFNGHKDTYNKELTIFNDMAGDVGQGDSHVKRIMDTLSLYFVGVY